MLVYLRLRGNRWCVLPVCRCCSLGLAPGAHNLGATDTAHPSLRIAVRYAAGESLVADTGKVVDAGRSIPPLYIQINLLASVYFDGC